MPRLSDREMEIIILLILAIAPCLAIGLFIYLKNKHKPGPPGLIIQSIVFGVFAFFLTMGLGLLIESLTKIQPDHVMDQIIHAMIFVGLVEEGLKFLFLRGVLYHRPSFTQPFDGIVYAVLISMGFATAENFLYLLQGEAGSLIVRMITAVPAHAAFAVLMGYFVGEAKVFPSSAKLFSVMGLAFAAFAHGYYDFFLLQKHVPGLWWLSIITLVIVIGITHYAIKHREEEVIEEMG